MTMEEFAKRALKDKIICYYLGQNTSEREIGFIYDIVKVKSKPEAVIVEGKYISIFFEPTGFVGIEKANGAFRFDLNEIGKVVFDASNVSKLKRMSIVLSFGFKELE